MRELVITPRAQRDLDEAFDWYAADRIEVALAFTQAFESAVDLLTQMPFVGVEVVKGARRWSVRRFDHQIYYRVTPKQVRVLAVYHAARDPRRSDDPTR